MGDDDPPLSRKPCGSSGNETRKNVEEIQCLENRSVSRFEQALAWLTAHLDDCPRPIIPYIKQTYELGNVDAVEAIRLARLKRGMETE